jgi:hypothetical protein
MKTCIVNINFSIHDNTKTGIHPCPTKSGKAIKIITGMSEEECMDILEKFFVRNGITVLEGK